VSAPYSTDTGCGSSTTSAMNIRIYSKILFYFCSLHTDEFMETLVEKFGDTKPVPRAGYGITFN